MNTERVCEKGFNAWEYDLKKKKDYPVCSGISVLE